MGSIRPSLGQSFGALIAALVLLAGVPSAPVPLGTQPAVFAGASGMVAFERGGDIWVSDAEGRHQVRLTDDAATDAQPAWSPDGRQIAFVSNRPLGTGAPNLYVMNADGSDQHQVGTEAAWTPAWSPDGRIAYAAVPDGGLHVVNADGTGVAVLTTNPGKDLTPSWSPDGTRIAFTSQRDGHPEVYVMNADGSGQTRLTTSTPGSDSPDWAPDGSSLIYGTVEGGSSGIRIMDPDGTDQEPIVPVQGADPTWSPDGTRIAFSGNNAITVMRADGDDPHQIIADGLSPAWQPVVPETGRFVYYDDFADSGQPSLYTTEADGSDRQLLLSKPENGFDVYPEWSPDGKKVAFYRAADDVGLWIVNADGSEPYRVGGIDPWLAPSWSPDGSRLAYTSFPGNAKGQIRVINADGTGDVLVLERPGTHLLWPQWSPDGTQIALAASTDQSSEIVVMDVDGSNQRKLTNGSFDDAPAWSPDGTLIAFARDPGEIYVVAPDGTGLRNVTQTPSIKEAAPKWSPDGSRIAVTVISGGGVPAKVVTMGAETGGFRRDVANVTQWYDWQPAPTLAPADVPPPTSFDVGDVTIVEGQSGTTNAVFTVSLSRPRWAPSTIHYATANGTATTGSDYSAGSGDLSFAPGETTKTVSVPVTGDYDDEADETFQLVLSAPTGRVVLADATGTATIKNDETVPARPVRVAAVGRDSRLYIGNGYAGAFRLEGGVANAGPALARIPKPDGTAVALEVVVGGDGRLYAKREGQTTFVRLSNTARCQHSPAAVVAPGGGGNVLVVACVGGDGALWYDVALIGATSIPVMDSFESLGGGLSAGPAVGVVQGALSFLGRGNDGRVYSRGVTGGWAQTPWRCDGHPALASWGATASFACTGSDGRLYYARNSGSGWSAPQGLGGIARGGPGLAATPSEAVMFIRGADDAVWQISVSPTRGTSQFSRLPSSVLHEVAATAL